MRLNLSPGMLAVFNDAAGAWEFIREDTLSSSGNRNYPEVIAMSDSMFVAFNAISGNLETYNINSAHVVTLTEDQFMGLVLANPDVTAMSATRIAMFSSKASTLSTYDFDGTDWTQVGNILFDTPSLNPTRIDSMTADRIVLCTPSSATATHLSAYDFDGTDWALVGNTLIHTVTSIARDVTSSSASVVHVSTDETLSSFEFDGTDWVEIGNPFTFGIRLGSSASFTLLAPNKVLEADHTSDKLNTFEFDGSAWVLTSSSPWPTGAVTWPIIVKLTETTIATVNRATNQLRTFFFNGVSWVNSGSMLTLGVLGVNFMTGLTPTRVVIAAEGWDEIRTYDWSGTVWTLAGNAGVFGDLNEPLVTTLTTTSIALIDSVTNSLQAYDFDGTDWTANGNPLTPITLNGLPLDGTITALTATRVCFADERDDKLRVYDFDGTDWAEVGNFRPFGFVVQSPRMVAVSATDIIMWSDTLGDRKITTLSFDGTDWTELGIATYVDYRYLSNICTVQGNITCLVDFNSKAISTFSWDGTDWTKEDELADVITNARDICSMGDARVSIIRTANGLDITCFDISATGIITLLPGTFDSGDGSGPCVAGISPTQFVRVDMATGPRIFDFDGSSVSTFALFGNALIFGGLVNPVMADLTPTRMMVANLGGATLFQAYDLILGVWTKVGNATQYRANNAGQLEIARLTDNRIIVSESSKDELQIWEFDGTDWAQFGTLYDFGKVVYPKLTALTETRIAFMDEDDDSLQAYDHDGTTWAPVGALYDLPGTIVNGGSLATIDSTHIILSNSSTATDAALLTIFEFDGLAWNIAEEFVQPLTNDDHNLISLGSERFLFLRKGTSGTYYIWAK